MRLTFEIDLVDNRGHNGQDQSKIWDGGEQENFTG